MFRLRSLSGLMAFDAAARHNSLTLAAKELGRTQSAVSQQVKGLEAELGLALFVRRPREIELTPEGRALAATLHSALKDIETTIAGLQMQDDPNILRLTTYQSFAIHWLIPRLPRFNLAHPEIDVRINADDQRHDLRAQGFDLAVRVGTAPDGVDILGLETFAPVYAPALAGGSGVCCETITNYRLLAHQHGHLWDEWFESNNLNVPEIDIATDFSHSGLLVQAAAAGGGIALAPSLIAAESVTSGRLVFVPGKPLATGCDYYIQTANQQPPEKVRKFINWMHQEVDDMRGDLGEGWA